MSREFQQIPLAPLYEISKDGIIQKVDKKTLILPYPIGSNNIRLEIDGIKQPFLVDELIKTVFGEKESKIESPQEENTIPEPEVINSQVTTDEVSSDISNDTEETPDTKPTPIKKETRGRKPKPKAPKKDFSSNPMIGKIMELDTFNSVKIWKLHNIGVSNEDITEIVNALHVTVIIKTLAEFEKKEKLRIRAEKVIVQ